MKRFEMLRERRRIRNEHRIFESGLTQGYEQGKIQCWEKELKFLKKLRFDKVWDMVWADVEKRIKWLEKKLA